MKRDRKSRVAYAAGIIDGEGYVGIKVYAPKKSRRSTTYTYIARLIVKMNSGEVMDFLHGMWGGCVNLTSQRSTGFFPGFCWELTGSNASNALKEMLPFLKTKKKQAETVIKLQTRIEVGKKISARGARRGNPLSEHEVAKRKALHEQVKYLNKFAITIPRARLTTEQTEKAEAAKQLAFKRQSELMGIKNHEREDIFTGS